MNIQKFVLQSVVNDLGTFLNDALQNLSLKCVSNLLLESFEPRNAFLFSLFLHTNPLFGLLDREFFLSLLPINSVLFVLFFLKHKALLLELFCIQVDFSIIHHVQVHF